MELDEIKQRTIDITKTNFHEYSSLDIVAFSFAVPGAQGEGGGIQRRKRISYKYCTK